MHVPQKCDVFLVPDDLDGYRSNSDLQKCDVFLMSDVLDS